MEDDQSMEFLEVREVLAYGMVEESKEDDQPAESLKVREVLAYAMAVSLLLFPILYAVDWTAREWRFWRYHLSLGAPAAFIFLAFVPGVLAVVYHLVTVGERRLQNKMDVKRYFEWLAHRKVKRAHQETKRTPPYTVGPVSANAASLLLTAVFLFVAVIAAYAEWWKSPLTGVVYAGLGAYSSILYFMVARLYASALSSRFLMSSAIGSASAVVMGWVFAKIGLSVLSIDSKSFNLATVLFLTGLFHKWAFDALRRRARKLFGQPDPATVELPLDIIEGIDDVHADLLSEYGVSTVQHLASAEPGELCERTLLPLDRLVGWIDQAILVSYFKTSIIAARGVAIRGAIDLILVYDRAALDPQGATSKLLDTLAEKTSIPRAAIDALALKLRSDYTVGLLYALQEGKEYVPISVADQVAPMVAREFSTNYDFVSGQSTTHFEIKRKA